MRGLEFRQRGTPEPLPSECYKFAWGRVDLVVQQCVNHSFGAGTIAANLNVNDAKVLHGYASISGWRLAR